MVTTTNIIKIVDKKMKKAMPERSFNLKTSFPISIVNSNITKVIIRKKKKE